MSISAADVKKLRDMTGAGMMDAKKALSETDGDFDSAVKYLREKGLADSKKRADKEANQGTIGDYIHFQQDRAVAGVLVELACETDFVAKSEEFKNVAKQVAMHIAALKPEFLNVEDVPEERIDEEKEIIEKQSENDGKPSDVISPTCIWPGMCFSSTLYMEKSLSETKTGTLKIMLVFERSASSSDK